MDNEMRMTTWCRMWSEDPALARDLMTDTCRQWSGQTPGLDAVVGAEQQVAFVAAYRERTPNVFRARVLVDAGDAFAYLWDVTLPDGTVHSGIDVNLLRGGLVEDNWTFVGARDDREPPPAQPVTAADAARLAAAHLAAAGRTRHRDPVVDAERGRVAVLWTSPDGTGVDLLQLRDGEVARAWSVTGARPFAY